MRILTGIFSFLVFLSFAPVETNLKGDLQSAAARRNSWNLRITAFDAYDEGEWGEDKAGGPFIDIVKSVCSEEDASGNGDPVFEPFHDTIAGMEVVNNTSSLVRFTRASFTITGAGAGGKNLRTKRHALIGNPEVPAFGRKKVFSFFLRADGSGKAAQTKGGDAAVPAGFKHVTVRLMGRTSAGKRYILSLKKTFSFTDANRCS